MDSSPAGFFSSGKHGIATDISHILMLMAKMLETTSFAAMVGEGLKIRISVGCGLLFLDAEAEQKTTVTASRV